MKSRATSPQWRYVSALLGPGTNQSKHRCDLSVRIGIILRGAAGSRSPAALEPPPRALPVQHKVARALADEALVAIDG